MWGVRVCVSMCEGVVYVCGVCEGCGVCVMCVRGLCVCV